MKLRPSICLVTIILVSVAGCSSDNPPSPDSSGTGTDTLSDTVTDSNFDSESGSNIDTTADTTSSTTTGDLCEPPDMLIVLDRTMSMHRQPSGTAAPEDQHELSKWYLAINAIETITAEYQWGLRFGLELFPRDPDDGSCVTLSQRIAGTTATNPHCEQGEVLVPPALHTAPDIASTLDPETTLLCNTTPIGAGFNTAQTYLASVQTPIRAQYALLLTDGQDTCDTPDPVERVQALAAAGISTFVVGFDSSGTGIDAKALNNMACAGKTAPDFKTNCIDEGTQAYVAADPNGAVLFLAASNGEELKIKLGSVAALVGCGAI